PVAGVVFVGVFLTIFPLSSIFPKATKKFGLGFFLSGIFSLVAYLFTCAAVLLLGPGHFCKTRPAHPAVSTIALLYCCFFYTSPRPRGVEESRMPSF
ncbi:hypothetical protein Q2418_25570, partial [Escherichia coli]|nr:hypothetical protein [Escherichia coli]